MNHQIENQLRQEFLRAVGICINQYGYRPTRFLQILENQGPVNTAIQLVMEPTYHEGFTKLWELNRLDLTVEAIIRRNPYNRLFVQEVLDRARNKLEELGYNEP